MSNLATALIQAHRITKQIKRWVQATESLEGHLTPKEAKHAMKCFGDSRSQTEATHISLMFPKYGEGSDIQVLEILLDGSDQIRETVVDDNAAVLCPLVHTLHAADKFDISEVLNRFYDLVPTAVPGPLQIQH